MKKRSTKGRHKTKSGRIACGKGTHRKKVGRRIVCSKSRRR